jgi:hypothetical protein
MHKTMASIASIAMAFLCIGITGCAHQPSRAYRTSGLDTRPPTGRVCMVSDQSCLSMMTSLPHTCPAFLTSERCNTQGSYLSIDVPVAQGREPKLDSVH